MTSAAPDYELRRASTGAQDEHETLRRFHRHLHNPRFWVVQGLVIFATAVHWGFELTERATESDLEGVFIVVMYAVYFVPVIYASLNFGREGAIPTAIWAAVLAIPSILFWHNGVHRLVEGAQHLTIIGLAVVIASRVDREVSARQRAERESAARQLSESRYRSLFDAAGDAILVFDELGIVREANATATERFGSSPEGLLGAPLERVLGKHNAALLMQPEIVDGKRSEDLIVPSDSRPVWLAPICSRVRTRSGPELIQAVLRDVTADRERRQGLELYARQVIQAQEEERRRISRELHDSPLQSLILLHRKLDLLESQSADLPDKTQQQLMDVRHQVVEIADELRRFSRDLRPSILDDLGLAPAVRWLANDLSDRTGVRVDFESSDTWQRLSSDVELGLFRIAQEALRNVERHAHASSVRVALTYADHQVRLSISDNGIGLGNNDEPIEHAAKAGKLGLLGMQERVRLLGGTLSIESEPNQGSRVEVLVPIDSSDTVDGF